MIWMQFPESVSYSAAHKIINKINQLRKREEYFFLAIPAHGRTLSEGLPFPSGSIHWRA